LRDHRLRIGPFLASSGTHSPEPMMATETKRR
jgi:hypothetical protein